MRFPIRALMACIVIWPHAIPAGQESIRYIAVLVDITDSFSRQQSWARGKAFALLGSLAQQRLHRWESATDQIALISVDALPDILWQGSLRQLKTIDPAHWPSLLKTRKEYAGCTDVAGSLEQALQFFDQAPAEATRYLYVFSDLVHDPPEAAIRTCQPPIPVPETFAWKRLDGIDASVYGVPIEQKWAWHQVLEAHDLHETFALYTAAESVDRPVALPARPIAQFTAEELKTKRAAYAQWGEYVLWGIGGITLLVVCITVGVLLMGRDAA